MFARRNGSKSIQAPFPLLLCIVLQNTIVSTNVGDIHVVVDKSLILSGNLYFLPSVIFHAVNRQYKVVGCYLQHNHYFHRSHDRYYVCNHQLTVEDEAHIMSVMEIFSSAKWVCWYTEENFNPLVTACDINRLGCKFRLMGDVTDIVCMKDLLCRQGRLRMLKKESELFAFFVPKSVRHLLYLYCEFSLADAAHRLNCCGYILWHATVVDHGGLGLSRFHALLPSESRASCRRTINPM